MVLLPELLEVEVRAAVQEGGDHGQVPAGKPEPPGPGYKITTMKANKE